MAPGVKIYRAGKLVSDTEGVIGETLLSHAGVRGVFLDAPCGGKGRCGKCLARLSPDGEQVLACNTCIDGDMEVYLPDESEMLVNSEFGIIYSSRPTRHSCRATL